MFMSLDFHLVGKFDTEKLRRPCDDFKNPARIKEDFG